MNSAAEGRLNHAVRYTVVGLWRGVETEVTYEDGRLFGPPDLMARVRALAESTEDLCHLYTSLGLIGKVLDEVRSLRVDDGQDPWDFEARPIRRLGLATTAVHERAARPAPRPPTIG